MPFPRQNQILLNIVRWVLAFAFICGQTPLLKTGLLALAVWSGEHEVALQARSGSCILVLHHRSGSHQHSSLTTALLNLAKAQDSPEQDHVLDLGSASPLDLVVDQPRLDPAPIVAPAAMLPIGAILLRGGLRLEYPAAPRPPPYGREDVIPGPLHGLRTIEMMI